MKRLTYMDDDGYWAVAEPGKYPNFGDLIDKLAAYEDLEEFGRLMILPCTVGDPIYWIDGDNNNEIVELVVKEFSYNKDGILCRAEYVDEKATQIFDLLEFEKVVFTDRKKAAAKVDVADADVEKIKVCADEKNNN